tara:strand:- start:1645 stop:2322 length:678 start_codon:yes stop_codon:yes gene_type:complete
MTVERKPKAHFIVSRYKEDPSWIKEYTDNYIIYNKGEPLDDTFNVKIMPNTGGNQYDISHFIHENYSDLPNLMAFVQGEPWDHCNKEKFDRIIYNEFFTALESYEHVDTGPNSAMRLSEDGGYMEINNGWYINAHNQTHNQACLYSSLDHFMNTIFVNYRRTDWVRFAPGSQYIIEKKQALRYSKRFWRHLMSVLPKNHMTEAHIVERSLMMILSGEFETIWSLK